MTDAEGSEFLELGYRNGTSRRLVDTTHGLESENTS